MAGEIQIVKPNLFLVKGVYGGKGSEVYFSLGDGKALKEASLYVDSVVAENVGQLRIGITSRMASDSLASLVYHTIISQGDNFKAPLREFLESLRYDHRDYSEPADLGKTIKSQNLPLVLWDRDFDPREILYARTDTPEDTEAYIHIAGALKDFERWAPELEKEGFITINKKATRRRMEKCLAELGSKVSDQRAVYHVVHGEMSSGQGEYPVGRISIYPLKIRHGKKIGRAIQALSDGLAKFDGPELSVDNAPEFMHSLKQFEPTIEAITREHGRLLRVTGAQKTPSRRLLFKE